MRQRKGKKGMFFNIDAFTALSILTVSILLFLTFYFYAPYKSQSYFYSQDILTLFSETKLYEIDYKSMGNISNYVRDGIILTLDNTLLQQIAEFYYRDETKKDPRILKNETIVNFTSDITHALISDRYSFGIYLYKDPFATSDTAEELYRRIASYVPYNEDLSNASNIFSSKVLVSGLFNNTEFYGPYVIEVRVWQ